MAATVTAWGLTKSYSAGGRTLEVLKGVDLELAAGDSLAVVGPSGSGKSTLLHLLGTLDKPTSGSLQIDGVDPTTLTGKALAAFRNRTVGFIFQDHHLLPQCSALENVLIPLLPGEGANDVTIARATDLLKRVGLADRADHLPSELSGGERQRVAVARALINGPKLLLCDEPTGNLDRNTAASITDLLLELQKASQAILVYVTHSLDLAKKMNRQVEINEGRLVASS